MCPPGVAAPPPLSPLSVPRTQEAFLVTSLSQHRCLSRSLPGALVLGHFSWSSPTLHTHQFCPLLMPSEPGGALTETPQTYRP
uniref:Uncharacterized protein n=1 Tax=Knipowitschia caucasica TaxID=637954 RepID=A0AAV2MEY9_KNICA